MSVAVDHGTETGREERWRDVRRARLIEAATRVFAAGGYDAASVDEIAAEAGIGKPTLYRYFESKEALFEAVFTAALDDLEVRLEEAVAGDRPFEQRLKALVSEIAGTFRTHIASMRDLDSGANSRRRLFRQRRRRIEALIARLVVEAQAQGRAGPFDAAIAARFLVGMIWSGTNSDLPLSALIDAVTDFTVGGLGRPAEPSGGGA